MWIKLFRFILTLGRIHFIATILAIFVATVILVPTSSESNDVKMKMMMCKSLPCVSSAEFEIPSSKLVVGRPMYDQRLFNINLVPLTGTGIKVKETKSEEKMHLDKKEKIDKV